MQSELLVEPVVPLVGEILEASDEVAGVSQSDPPGAVAVPLRLDEDHHVGGVNEHRVEAVVTGPVGDGAGSGRGIDSCEAVQCLRGEGARQERFIALLFARASHVGQIDQSVEPRMK